MTTTRETQEAATTTVETERERTRPLFRIVLVLAVFLLCCYAAFHIGAFIATSRGAARRAAAQADAEQISPLSAAMPLAGQWAFDELDWSVESSQIDTATLDAEFASLAASIPADTAALPDADAEIVGLMTALQIPSAEKMGNLIYRIDRPDLRTQLVTRRIEAATKAVSFAMAFPLGDRWQLFAFTPRESSPVAAIQEDLHLLPLPEGAHRTGGRFDDAGRPLMEFISLDSNADGLAAAWEEAGWEVRPSGLTDSTDFSVLCARGTDTVYAWSADPPDAIKNLMLVRTPAPTDTSP
jgi:hypothetical protein